MATSIEFLLQIKDIIVENLHLTRRIAYHNQIVLFLAAVIDIVASETYLFYHLKKKSKQNILTCSN